MSLDQQPPIACVLAINRVGVGLRVKPDYATGLVMVTLAHEQLIGAILTPEDALDLAQRLAAAASALCPAQPWTELARSRPRTRSRLGCSESAST